MEEGAEGSEEECHSELAGTDQLDRGPRRPGMTRVADRRTADPTTVAESASRRSAVLEYGLAMLVSLWLTRAFWLPGRFVIGFDTVAYAGPNYRVTIDAWRDLRLPLWNDAIFGGVTHLGNPQAGALSPTRIIGIFLDTNRAMNITVALHVVVMAIGTVALLRRLGARAPAGLAAAVVMVGNGAVMTRTIQFEQIVVLAWTPLLLVAITAVLRSDDRRWGAMAATASVTSLVLLAGHPQILYQVVLIAAVWTVALMSDGRSRARLLDVLASVTVGALVAALQLVAAVAATSDSAIGSERTPEELVSPLLSTQPHHLLQLILGSVRGVEPDAWAGGFESTGHLGVVAAFLAVSGIATGLVRARERALTAVLTILVVLGVVWSLGPRTPVFTFAYDVIPGFALARASARWIDITVVASAILVGLAIEGLRTHRPGLEAVLVPTALFGVSLALGLSGVVLFPTAAFWVPWVVTAAVIAFAIVGLSTSHGRRLAPVVLVGIVVVLGVETLAANRPSSIDTVMSAVPFDEMSADPSGSLRGEPGLVIAFTDDSFGDPPYLVAGFRPNTNVLAGVPSIDGYDGGVQVTERFASLIRTVSPNPQIEMPLRNNLPLPLTVDLASELGIRWAVVDDRRDTEMLLPFWVATDLSKRGFTIWENPAWLGDAVMTDPDGVQRSAPLASPRPGHLLVDVSVEPAVAVDRQLIVHRQAAPGWTASIDGETVPLRPGDGFFLEIDLPAGAQQVEFRYEPMWVRPGSLASLVGLVGIAAMVAMSVGGRRRRREAPLMDCASPADEKLMSIDTRTNPTELPEPSR